MDHPQKFFDEMFLPAYVHWQGNPYSVWAAKAAVMYADALAERISVFINYKGGPKAYREYLRTTKCEEFGWIWDIADGVKHVRLTRGQRRVSAASQTNFEVLPIDEWGNIDEVSDFDKHGAIIVTGDDNSRHDLAYLMERVVPMFESVLVNIE